MPFNRLSSFSSSSSPQQTNTKTPTEQVNSAIREPLPIIMGLASKVCARPFPTRLRAWHPVKSVRPVTWAGRDSSSTSSSPTLTATCFVFCPRATTILYCPTSSSLPSRRLRA